MAQTPTYFRADGAMVDFTPSAGNVTGGDVNIVNNQVIVAKDDITNATLGAVARQKVFRGPKDASSFSQFDPVFWNVTGSPTVGTASSGCFTSNSAAGPYAGIAASAQVTGDSTIDVILTPSLPATKYIPATVAATGSVIGNAAAIGYGVQVVSGADNTKGVILPPAIPGQGVTVKNNTSGKILKVYPAVGAQINDAGANAVYNVAALATRTFDAFNATAWYTAPETIA